MILVTGATGTVGREVVKQLTGAGRRVRVLVRSPEKAKALDPRAEVVLGDLAQRASIQAAFAGVDKAFLCAAGPALPDLDGHAIDAARAAGVGHVVKLSAHVVEVEPGIQISRWHLAGEESLRASGIPWTILRPVQFATNALFWMGTIKTIDSVFQPTGEGRVAVVDPRDIAAVAVAALTESGHERRHYALTGPEALTTADQVRLISEAVGRPLRFVSVPEQAAREKMLQSGMPALMTSALLELMALVKAGRSGIVTRTIEEVLERKPRGFGIWAKENAAVLGQRELSPRPLVGPPSSPY